MKIKRIKVILILFLMVFFIPFSIKADVSCEKVQNAVDEYNNIVTELDTTDCSDTTDNSVVKQCNDLNTRKALQLSKLFKYNDLSDCDNPELRTIIKDNEETCTNVFGSTLKDLTNNVMGIFYIIAPFLLIIFGSIDFSKIVVMNDPKMIKTARTNFFKRLAAFVLLYMVPALVNLILNFNFSNYSLTGNVYSCKTEFAYQMNRWDITYIPPVEETKSNSSGGSNSNLGLGANNGIFPIRTETPTKNNSYYNFSAANYGECPWFAKYRAIEAVSTSNFDETKKQKILAALNKDNTIGHGWTWYYHAIPGVQQNPLYSSWANGNNIEDHRSDLFVGFKYSDDYTKPRAGAIVSWNWTNSECSKWGGTCYGHVGFVEDVNEETGEVYLSDGWNGDSGMRTSHRWMSIEDFKTYGSNNSNRYEFAGYVYLFD